MGDFILRNNRQTSIGKHGTKWMIRGRGLIDAATKAKRFDSEEAAQRLADEVNARLANGRAK